MISLLRQTILQILFFLLLFQSKMFSQSDSIYFDGRYDESLEESYSGESYSDETNSEEYEPENYETIEYYRNNPLDINKAGIQQLLELPFMDYWLAEKIVDYRSSYGRIFSLSELYSIKEIDKNTINQVVPFLHIESIIDQKTDKNTSFTKSADSNIKTKERGFSAVFRSRMISFSGSSQTGEGVSPFRQYNKLTLSYKGYSFGALTEKDPGENSLVDFSSFYFSAKDKDNSRMIILGDYKEEFGQGLVMWGGYNSNKSKEIYSSLRNDRNFHAYTSTNENSFLRGLAACYDKKSYRLSSFVSYNALDAVVNDSAGYVTSLPSSGYHRTNSEKKNEDKVNELLLGSRVDFRIDSLLSVGILYAHSDYNPSLKLKTMAKETSKSDAYSLAYRLLLNNILFSGEVAYCISRLSSVLSFALTVTDKMQFLVEYRNFDRASMTIHSSVQGGKSSLPGKQTGILTGLKLNTDAGNISLYYEQFKLGSSYVNPVGFNGNELLMYYNASIGDMLEGNLRFSVNRKESLGGTNNYRAEIICNVNKALRLKTRFDYCNIISETGKATDNGRALYEDFFYKVEDKITLNGRFSLYNTDSYDSRFYEYENDLPGVMNSALIYGKGVKFYMLVKYRLDKSIDISFKYSQDSKRLYSLATEKLYGPDIKESSKLSIQLDVQL
ncbi:MAG: helix-hairpin-helix domain-containing protein [Bacteroidota bacterium]|nr:helix-hairpin-helix domain-containing protein [Bacteroidota bacterium]